jgi:D-alanyl-D-alanine carboxypeptidase
MIDGHVSAVLRELGISAVALSARGLRSYAEAKDLVVTEVGKDGREHLLVPDAARAWKQLRRRAEAHGVELFIVSAYRSIERQAELIRRKLDAGWTIDEIVTVCAAPGFSEHHTGRAVDVGTPSAPLLERAFEDTSAFRWLTLHAATSGYTLSYPPDNPQGYEYEPWHWCFARAPLRRRRPRVGGVARRPTLGRS